LLKRGFCDQHAGFETATQQCYVTARYTNTESRGAYYSNQQSASGNSYTHATTRVFFDARGHIQANASD
jgi:hypothetical protein